MPVERPTGSTLDRSIRLAVVAHAGQVDKNGEPYIPHPLRVMELVRRAGGDQIAMSIAVLHDVIEDSDFTMDDIIDALLHSSSLLSIEVIRQALVHLTHSKDVPYAEYVANIATSPLASFVKWADTSDNWARLPLVTDQATRERLELKYGNSFVVLGETPEQHALRMMHRASMVLDLAAAVIALDRRGKGVYPIHDPSPGDPTEQEFYRG